ncbi:MAG: hypothetical protein Q8N76_05510 [Candidatus Omnitrophota bacterium]|nr:hypothetical protein [Candidatus Omnitrophota bacterium]
MRKVSLILLAIVSMLIFCKIADAGQDSDSQNSIVTLAVPNAGLLDICSQANATKTLDMDGDGEVDFEAGYTDMLPGYPTLTIKTNRGWKLFAKSSGFSANETYIKDTGDLTLVNTGLCASNGFNAFKALTLENQEIAFYDQGVRSDSNAMQYRIKLDWAKDTPGTYTATVTYTLSTQG